MNHFRLFGLVCALLPAMAWSAVLTPEQALSRVTATGRQHVVSRVALRNFTLDHAVEANGVPTVYVMQAPGGERIFVSADDCVAPLLGYTDAGDAAAINPSAEQWLAAMSSEIAEARLCGSRPQMPIADGARDIEPLLQTKWGQGEPYNLTTPIKNGMRCPTGCTATSMAQVINYHRYPTHGVGQIEYQYPSDTEPVTFDFEAATFEYDKMLPQYQRGSYTDEQAMAVSVLMEACGKATRAEYWSSETGASVLDEQAGLAKYFGLDPGLHLISRFAYPLRKWVQILYEELAANRPILYSGQTNDGGHAFVVDGYSAADGLFHVNWGWNGGSNGYFLITGLDPGMQGTGGSNGAYNANQQAIIGVQPPTADSREAEPEMMLVCDFGPQAKTHMRPSGVSFLDMMVDCTLDNGGFRVNCRDSVMCQVGIRFENLATGEVTISWNSNRTMWDNTSIYYIHPTFNIGQTKGYNDLPVGEGRYRVTPIARFGTDEDAEIHDVLVSCGRRQEVTMTVNEFNINVTADLRSYLSGSDMKAHSTIYAGRQFKISATLTAKRGEFMGRIHPELAKGTQDVAIHKFDNAMVSCPLDDQTLFVWSGKMPADIEPGEYVIRLNDDYSAWICSVWVEVNEGSGECVVEMSDVRFENVESGSGDRYDPYVIDDSMIRVRGRLNCTSGFFDHTLQCRIMDGFDILYLVSCGNYFLDEGEGTDLELDLGVPEAEADHTYGFRFYERFTSSQGYTTDRQIGNSVYFRLKQQDYAGADGIVASAPIACDGRVVTAQGAESVRVYNAQGQLVGESEGDAYDMSGLRAGIYVAVATMPDGRGQTLRFRAE